MTGVASERLEAGSTVGAPRRKPSARRPTDVAPHEIERSLKRGAIWAMGSQVAVQAIRLGGVVVLARLLTPGDYGAAAFAITLASFSMLLGDLGYGTALVQARTASQRWASTACWCALAAGVIGFGLAAIGAHPVAAALGEARVTGLVIAGGATLFLVGLGSTSNAFLTRSMSFGAIQAATMVAWIFATGGAIAAASIGAGPWALVLQQVVIAAVTSALFILAARWRPSREFSRSAFRSLTKFALPFTGASLFFVLQGLVTVLLVGHFVGVEELGIWNLSMAVVIVPLSLLSAPLARVIYAAFARMRESPERVAEVWLNGSTLLAAVAMPALFGLIAVAPDLIPFAFGSQWVGAVTVIQILAALIMARTLQTWNEAVLDAAGKPRIAMMINAAVLAAVVPSMWVGSQFGIEGAAVSYVLAALVAGELPSFIMTTRELSLNAWTVLGRMRGILFSAGATCVAVVFLRQALERRGVPVEPRLVLSIIAGAIVYVSCMALVANGVARDVLRMVRSLAPSLQPTP